MSLNMAIAKTPKPPYYAVIFTSLHSGVDAEGYATMAAKMEELAAKQPGYLGIESARSPDGLGITVSYWQSAADIAAWKFDADHRIAQQFGIDKWYEQYQLRIAKVERDYEKPT